MKTNIFDPLRDIDVLDPSGGVSNVAVQQIVSDAGIHTDNNQGYPITAWLDVFSPTPMT